MAIRWVGTPSLPANSEVAVRMVSMHTAGESGRRFPAAGPGKSTRSTVSPTLVTASSIATSPDWSRRALAPGVSTRPTGPDVVIGPSWPLGDGRVIPDHSTRVYRRTIESRGPPAPARSSRRASETHHPEPANLKSVALSATYMSAEHLRDELSSLTVV